MRDWRSPDTEQALLDGGLEQVFGGIPAVDVEHYLAVLRQPGALTAALAYYRAQSARRPRGPRPGHVADAARLVGRGPRARRRGRRTPPATTSPGPYRFEVLHGVSHWVPEQAPDRLSALLLEHLR